MKQILAGIVLILVLGIGSLLYRNVLERPSLGGAVPGGQKACTLEAKMCPDGTSVGRSGPNCALAACPAPNVTDSTLGISYVTPAGYVSSPNAFGTDATLRAAYEKQGMPAPADSIAIHSFPILAGKTANDTIVANTTYEPSGAPAKSIAEFKQVTYNGKAFYFVTVERFESQVHTVYYLPRTADVLRFEITEHGITNWADPKLDVSALPGHQALLRLLSALQASG
jgi:hypothetical protein